MAEKKGQYTLTAKTLFGLEEILAEELRQLGASDIEILKRAVSFSGDKALMYRANICCRTATRILKPIAVFHAADGDELYSRIARISWSRFMDNNNSLAVDSVVSHSGIANSQYAAQRVKDAIVDQFREKTGQRPSVDLENPDIRLNLHIHQDRATISLDSSGIPLHKRGYRTSGGPAPLNECLAAGIVLMSGWDGTSSFIDPMCGSGTIVLEAAMIADRIAPGLGRTHFGFMNFKDYAPGLYRTLIEKEKAHIRTESSGVIVGSDRESSQIALAKEHARRAGLANRVSFSVSDFAEQTPPPAPGVLITNPPYGERLRPDDLERLYQSIGDTLKGHYTDYDAFIFTGNLPAAKKIGLRTSRRIHLFNGPLECRLLKFEMYRGSRKASKNQSPQE